MLSSRCCHCEFCLDRGSQIATEGQEKQASSWKGLTGARIEHQNGRACGPGYARTYASMRAMDAARCELKRRTTTSTNTAAHLLDNDLHERKSRRRFWEYLFSNGLFFKKCERTIHISLDFVSVLLFSTMRRTVLWQAVNDHGKATDEVKARLWLGSRLIQPGEIEESSISGQQIFRVHDFESEQL